MLLGDAWDSYKELTKSFSDNARKLAFAVAAICWFFRIEGNTDGTNEIVFPFYIIIALTFIVLFLLLDISQYFVQTILWRKWITGEQIKLLKEDGVNKLEKNMNIIKPKKLDATALKLLYFKTVALYFACLFLILHFTKMIFK